MSRRSRQVTYGAAGLLVLIGMPLGLLLGGETGELTAMVLIALGLMLASLAIFFDIGMSEERDRARAQARGGSATTAEPPSGRAAAEGKPPVPQAERERQRELHDALSKRRGAGHGHPRERDPVRRRPPARHPRRPE
jgi:hypothetical protein